MKLFKNLILVGGVVLFLIAIALVSVTILVDPNDYKPEIESVAKQLTGRDLLIKGDIDLSVFPWLGLELGETHIANADGFAEKYFISVDNINIKVSLRHLWLLQTKVGVVQLVGMDVNLQQKADGSTNWQDLLAETNTAGEVAPEPVPSGSADSSSSSAATAAINDASTAVLSDIYIGGIDVRKANVRWRDDINGVQSHLENFSFKTGRIRSGESTAFSAAMALRHSEPKLIASVTAEGKLLLDLVAQQYGISDVQLNIKASGTPVPGNEQRVNITVAAIQADLQAQTAAIEQAVLKVASLTAKVGIQLTALDSDSPQVTGDVQLDIPSIRQLMQNLQLPVPETADPSVLGALSFAATLQADSQQAALNAMQLQFDQSQLTGQLAIKDFATSAIEASLVMDKFDADRYLPPVPEQSEAAAAQSAADQDPLIELPLDLISGLNTKLEIKIADLRMMQLQTNNVATTLQTNNGIVNLNPVSIDLYDGHFDGSAQLDINADKPHYKAVLDLKNVNSGPLLKDYVGEQWIDGKANMQADITTQGERVSELMRQLNGDMQLAFLDGALSMDMRQSVRAAMARFNKRKYQGEAKQPTKFSSIKANSIIKNGVVINDDLEMRARYLLVTGKGQYDLPKEYVDYIMTVVYAKGGTALQGSQLAKLSDTPINFHFKGVLGELDYLEIGRKAISEAVFGRKKAELDAKKAAAETALAEKKRQAAEKLKAEKAAARAAAEQRQRELKEKQRQKLEAEKAKLEAKKQEKKDKLKNKLKDLF